MTPTLIIGDSHGIFLARALGTVRKGVWDAALDAPLAVNDEQGHPVAEFILLNPKAQVFEQPSPDKEVQVREPYAGMLRAHDHPDHLCLVSMHGNDHNGRFMCRHEVPFDVVCPHVPDALLLGRQILPRTVLLRELGASGMAVRDKLAAVRRMLPRTRVAFVMPPPPIPDEAHIRACPEAFDFDRHPLEDKWVRLKIHHAYAEVLAAVCRQLDVPALPPPAAALDEEGFLAHAHWQGATHAAPGYYQLLLSQHGLTRKTHASLQALA